MGLSRLRVAASSILRLLVRLKSERLKLAMALVLLLVLYVPYLNFGRFVDETDNLIGGMVVQSGGRVYGEFYSQHTPLMYYLTAFFGWLGASTVAEYRAFFYLFLTGCFSFIYFRYVKYFGVFPLIAYPLVYVLSLGQMDEVSHMILSEHVQAQAMVVILLELLLLGELRVLKLSSKIIVAISSFVAVGVAFVAIYAVAVAYGVMFLLLFLYQADGRGIIKRDKLCVIKDCATSLLFLFIPFLSFFVWSYFENNVENVYRQAYWLNRNVYPRYNGGLGGNAWSPVVSSFSSFFLSVVDVLSGRNSPWLNVARILLNKCAFIVFVFMFTRKNVTLSLGVFFFVILNTMRGDLGFHALQYWAITAMMLSLVLNRLVNRSRELGGGYFAGGWAIAILCGSLILFLYFSRVHTIFNSPIVTPPEKELSCEFYAKTLLGEGDGFFVTSIQPSQLCYVESRRLPGTKAYSVVPWFTDVFEKEIIDDLDRNRTKLIFHNSENKIWGWVLKDYAPSLDGYILDNYTRLDSRVPDVYIRNEYYNEAIDILAKLSPDFYGERAGVSTFSPDVPVGELYAGYSVEQRFVAEHDGLQSVSILLATYNRRNSSKIRLGLLDESGYLIFQSDVDAMFLEDNKFYSFKFPVIGSSRGKKYSVRIEAISGSPGNSITAWMSKSDIYAAGELFVNGRSMEGDLSMILFYKR